MGRSGSIDYSDRFFGAIVYLLALSDAVSLLGGLLTIPALRPLFSILTLLLTPVAIVNSIIPFGFGSLVIFFVLLLAVVQNPKISYFIRFNTMQSILIGIALSLVGIIIQTIPGLGLISSMISIFAIGICLFCMVQCILGRLPYIPSFSQFVDNYVPK